ncbi:pilus assembly protein TadG-related protein [Faunimonas sp. B44]|uniref:pilus assembly protein TadG-related protein n=1 Tax=Faunimonas sp. B44 TaxID=3461493 RepID=UPI0040443C85
MFSRYVRKEDGSVAILAAFALPVVLMAAGLSLDHSSLSTANAKLQSGADAAALAAAIQLGNDDKASDSRLEERSSAIAAVSFAATGSPFAGTVNQKIESRKPAVVTVQLTQPQRLAFGGLFGIDTLTLKQSATATAARADPVCLLLLDPSASAAWSNQGSSAIDAKGCVAQVNSASSRALHTNGSAAIETLSTRVVGPAQPAAQFSPAPIFGQPVLADPIAPRLDWPHTPPCTYSNVSLKSASVTLVPGTFCGGLALSSGATLNLKAGEYVIRSGNLDLGSGSALIAPEGTTIILTAADGIINMQGGARLVIKAPDDGPWKGIALAVKPQSSERTSALIGGGETDISGIVYLPTQKLKLSGGGALAQPEPKPRVFVVNRIEMGGNGNIYLAGSSDLLALPSEPRLTH